MTQQVLHRQIEMIPTDSIDVLNPRQRSSQMFRTMVRNIEMVGLKRPITVSRRHLADGSVRYALICGQGRLEAFRVLQQSVIPAFVADVEDPECMVMSLVENLARREHRGIELVREVGALSKRGASQAQIAERIGVAQSWVCGALTLLNKGEGKLLASVDSGVLPLSMAVEISKSGEPEVQRMLAEAYEQGKLRGRKLEKVRRMLKERARCKDVYGPNPSGPRSQHKASLEDLQRDYEEEAAKQRTMSRNAAYAQERLIFVREVLRELLADVEFVQLLGQEGMPTLPRLLDVTARGDRA